MKYWIGVASKDHVLKGQQLGIAQFCHGKQSAAKRLHKGDYLIYYSPRITMEGSTPCQKFTAIGYVRDDLTYQVEMSTDFKPFRRNIFYFPNQIEDVSIKPLINDLSFIRNKKSWGMTFRTGLIEIDAISFDIIATQLLGFNPSEQNKSSLI